MSSRQLGETPSRVTKVRPLLRLGEHPGQYAQRNPIGEAATRRLQETTKCLMLARLRRACAGRTGDQREWSTASV